MATVYDSSHALDSVDSLEAQLMRSLRRVEPDREFVDHLHTRLSRPPDMILERRQHIGFSLLLIAVSFVSGAFLVWLMRHFRAATTAA